MIRGFIVLSFFIYCMLYLICQIVVATLVTKTPRIRVGVPVQQHVYQIIALVLLIIAIKGMRDSSLDNLFVLRYIGVVVMILGIALSMWALVTLDKNWVAGVGLHKKRQWVTSGPFRYVRHPLYSGMIISAAGLSLITLNVLYSLACFLFAWSYCIRTWNEEPLMRKRFGRAYEDYAKQTGRFFPSFRRR